MNTLQEQWESYRDTVISPDAGKTQLMETEQGFYAGAVATMHLMQTFSDSPEDIAIELTEGLHQELNMFFEERGKMLFKLVREDESRKSK